MKAILIIAVLVLAGCGAEDKIPQADQAEMLERVGKLAGAEASLPTDAWSTVIAYVDKEQTEIQLASETLPGRVAVQAEELRDKTERWKKLEKKLRGRCAEVRSLARLDADWPEDVAAAFSRHSDAARKKAEEVEEKYHDAVRAADVYLSAAKWGDSAKRNEMHAWYMEILGELGRMGLNRSDED